MGKPAQALAKSVRTIFELYGWFVWSGGTGAVKLDGGRFARFGSVGAPDLLAIKDGICAGLEVKAGKDKMRHSQQEWADAFIRHGGRYFVLRSTVDALDAVFELEKKCLELAERKS